jgi:hypothetical protein
MRRWCPILIVLAGLGGSFSSSMFAQQTGSYKCEDEQVRPNLHMEESANVSGIVLDESGAIFPQIILRIQNPHNTWVLMSTAVNDKGEFDFGRVPSGEFRLVPVKLVDGKATRVAGFDPPRSLTCVEAKKCELRVILPIRPTDLPYENCPPK